MENKNKALMLGLFAILILKLITVFLNRSVNSWFDGSFILSIIFLIALGVIFAKKFNLTTNQTLFVAVQLAIISAIIDFFLSAFFGGIGGSLIIFAVIFGVIFNSLIIFVAHFLTQKFWK